MRVGAASPYCVNVAVLLGVREGEGFRRHQGITVMNVRSLVEPAVAEIELDPGEYHIVAYRCQTQGRHQDGGRRRRARHLRHQLCELPVGAGRGRQRRLPARRGLAPRPQHVRPADADGCGGDGLAACRARALQGQAPAHLRADEDAADDGDAPGAGPADEPGLRAAQGPEGRGQGAGASPGMCQAGRPSARRPQLPSRAAISKPAGDSSCPIEEQPDAHGHPPPCPMPRHDRGPRRDRPHRQGAGRR